MGRSKKNKKRQQSNSNQQRKKKARTDRFWIADCPNVSDNGSSKAVIDVLITRVELEDNYKQVSQPIQVAACDGDRATVVASKPEATSNGEAKSSIAELKTSNEGDQEDTKQVFKVDEEASPDTKFSKDLAALTKEDEKPTSPVSSPPTTTSTLKTNNDVKEEETKQVRGVEEKIEIEKVVPLVCVKRTASAKGKLQKFYSSSTFKPLPNGDCGDGVTNPYPKSEVADKFWSQRRRLFTRFDEGIKLDKESWFSVTPEEIAKHIADRMICGKEKLTIIDMFCGCGGNAIAFGLREEVAKVVCVDTDLEKLKMAAHNAKIYGISKEKMIFIHNGACKVLTCYEGGTLLTADVGNAKSDSTLSEDFSSDFKLGGLELLPESIDMAFVSPPWGGMDYGKVGKRNYTLKCINIEEDNEMMDGDALLERAAHAFDHKAVALFLPRNINGIALGKSVFKAGYEGPIVLEQNILNGKLKTVTAYVGIG